MSYYRTNAHSVLEAVSEYKKEIEKMQCEGRSFAESYGGSPIFLHSITGQQFGGVKFSPRNESPLWTNPDRNFFTQSPRSRAPAGSTAEERQEAKRLSKEWADRYPKTRVSGDIIYKSLGKQWGDFAFSSIGYFEGVDGYFYIKTDVKLDKDVEEIKGSEYMLAKEALESKKKGGSE